MAKDANALVAAELRKQTSAELSSRVAAKREELHKLRFKHALNQLPKTHVLRQIRRDIAKLQTVINEKAGSK